MATTAVGNRQSFKNALGKWNKKQDGSDVAVKSSSKKSLQKKTADESDMDVHELVEEARHSKGSLMEDYEDDLEGSSKSLSAVDKLKSMKPKKRTSKKSDDSGGEITRSSHLSPKKPNRALDLNSYHGHSPRKNAEDDDLRSQSEHRSKTKSKKKKDVEDDHVKSPRGYRRKYGDQKHVDDDTDIQHSKSEADGDPLHESNGSMGSTRSLGARRNSRKIGDSSEETKVRKSDKRESIGTEGEMELKDSGKSKRGKASLRRSGSDNRSEEVDAANDPADLASNRKSEERLKKSDYEVMSHSTGSLGSGLTRRTLKETLFGGGRGYVEMEDEEDGEAIPRGSRSGRRQKSKSTEESPFGSREPRSARQSTGTQRPKAYSTASIENDDDDPEESDPSKPRIRRRRSLVDRISVFEKSPKEREAERVKSKEGMPNTPNLAGKPRRGRSIEDRMSIFQSPKRDDAAEGTADASADAAPPRRRRRSQEIRERMSRFEGARHSSVDEKPEEPFSPRRRKSLELAQKMSKFEGNGSEHRNSKGIDGLPGAPDLASPRRRKSVELREKMAAFQKSTDNAPAEVKEEQETPTRPKRNLVDRLKKSGVKSTSDLRVESKDDSGPDGETAEKSVVRKPISRRAVSDGNISRDSHEEEEGAGGDTGSTPAINLKSPSHKKGKRPSIADKIEKLTEEEIPKLKVTPKEPSRKGNLGDRISKFNNKAAPPAFLGFVSPRHLKKKKELPQDQESPSKAESSREEDSPSKPAKPRRPNEAPLELPSPPMSDKSDKNGGLGNRIKAFDKSNGTPFSGGRASLKKKKDEEKTPVSDKKSLLGDESRSNDDTPAAPEKDNGESTQRKQVPKKVPMKQEPSTDEKSKDDAKDDPDAPRKRPPGKRGLVRRKSSGLLNKMGNVTTASLGDMKMFVPPTFHKDHTDETLIEKALRRNFVFDDLNEKALKVFIAAFEECRFSKGDSIIKQGDTGDFFYVIARGKVRFSVDGSDVGSADAGMSFGELSLLYTCPRTATVNAETNPTKLFRVDQKTFRFIMQKMSRKLNQDKLDLLNKIKFLKNLGESDLNRLSAVMVPRKFLVGDRIIHKGDVGDAFYIIQAGELSVTDISFGKTKYEDITLGPGDHFGERALVTNELAAANVIALSSGTLFSIEKETFEKLLGDYSSAILRSVDKFALEGIKFFRDHELKAGDYDQLAAYVTDMTLTKKDKILVEGEETEAALYLVREGTVKITTNDFKRSDRISAGGFFGQEYLTIDTGDDSDADGNITPEYTATVYSEECVVGVLKLADCRNVFDTTRKVGGETIFNQCQSFLDKRATIRESIKNNLPLEALNRERVLGEGQFAEVWLVSTEVDLGPDASELNNKFAMKVQLKDDPNRQDCLETIQREISVLSKMDHPFIIELFHTYEDPENISMLTKAVFGGELWSVIHQEDEEGNWNSGLTEEHAQFYALNIADTLAYMHRKTIVFRDLKPENVLVDKDGYPIIVDFGFAKYCPDKTFTFCGTPNYVSPEIVMNRGHGFGADHWALGILIYEMTTGENPFYADGMDNMTLFQAIVQEDYYPLPETKSVELKSILDGLLEKDPASRLGVLQGGEKDILTHKWFDGSDLVKLRAKGVTAPYIPHAKEE